jgi:hypothetical protein
VPIIAHIHSDVEIEAVVSTLGRKRKPKATEPAGDAG